MIRDLDNFDYQVAMAGHAYDFSKVPGPSVRELVAAGARGVLVYSFASRPTDDYLDECRRAGLEVVWIWERDRDSILFLDGADECRAHEARAAPGELTYVACDLNNGDLAGRDVTRFCREWASATREREFGLYGSQDAIAQGQASGIPKLTKWWGVVNWITGGGPDNDPRNIAFWHGVEAHIVQLIGSPVDDTDQNLILRDDWAAFGTRAPTLEDDDMKTMIFTIRKSDGKTFCWWRSGSELLMRGFANGKPEDNVLTVFDQCDPTNLHIEDAGFGVLYTPSANGRLVRVTHTPKGPISTIV